MFDELLPTPTPAATEHPIESEPPVMTSAEIGDLHTVLIDLRTEQQNTNGLLIFLIALICGVVFFQNFMKGWVK